MAGAVPSDEAAAAREYRLAAHAGLDWGQYNYANLVGYRSRHGARPGPSADALSPGRRAGPRQVDEPAGALSGRRPVLPQGSRDSRRMVPTLRRSRGFFGGSSAMQRCWRTEGRSTLRWNGCARLWRLGISNSCERRIRRWHRPMTRRFAPWPRLIKGTRTNWRKRCRTPFLHIHVFRFVDERQGSKVEALA